MLFTRQKITLFHTCAPSHLNLHVLHLVRDIARRGDLGLGARGLARSLCRGGGLGQLPDEGQELGLAGDVLAEDLRDAEPVLGLVVLEDAAKAALSCGEGGVLDNDVSTLRQ